MTTVGELTIAIQGRLKTGSNACTAAEQSLGQACIDTREIAAGQVFWALRGPRRDGAAFVDAAFARGAAGAVVATDVDVPDDRWIIRVQDTQEALWQAAAWCRQRFCGMPIAVTGSVGKTTTRQMIHTVLGTRLQGSASPRNYNNHIGVPLSLLQTEPEHDYAVLELGASRRGEIASLAGLSAPRLGVITQIGEAHLAGFGNRRAIAQSKAELLAALPSDGHAVLADDPWLRAVADNCAAPITWVGANANCDVRATDIETAPGLLTFRVSGCPFQVPVWGRHHLTAALCAVAVGRLLGFDLDEMSAAIRDFRPVAMRCEVLEIRGATVINDTYNANPTAMQAALELVRDLEGQGRRIVVLGDMGELGEQSSRLHWELGRKAIVIAGADMLIACGQFARYVTAGARSAGLAKSRAIPCDTIDQTLPYLGQAMLPGDIVLVKGSRTVGMERIIKALNQYPGRRSA